MTSRPLAVLGAGLATLAVAALHAATSRRRNTATQQQTYAQVDYLRPTTRLTSSANLYELTFFVPLDDVNPDMLGENICSMTDILLQEATKRAVALDWPSFRFHIFDNVPEGVAHLIGRVDVL